MASYYAEDKKDIIENYITWRSLSANLFSELVSTIDVVNGDERQHDCLVETEIAFERVITSIFMRKRGMRKSQNDIRMVCIVFKI